MGGYYVLEKVFGVVIGIWGFFLFLWVKGLKFWVELDFDGYFTVRRFYYMGVSSSYSGEVIIAWYILAGSFYRGGGLGDLVWF